MHCIALHCQDKTWQEETRQKNNAYLTSAAIVTYKCNTLNPSSSIAHATGGQLAKLNKWTLRISGRIFSTACTGREQSTLEGFSKSTFEAIGVVEIPSFSNGSSMDFRWVVIVSNKGARSCFVMTRSTHVRAPFRDCRSNDVIRIISSSSSWWLVDAFLFPPPPPTTPLAPVLPLPLLLLLLILMLLLILLSVTFLVSTWSGVLSKASLNCANRLNSWELCSCETVRVTVELTIPPIEEGLGVGTWMRCVSGVCRIIPSTLLTIWSLYKNNFQVSAWHH